MNSIALFFFSHYDCDSQMGNPRSGWAYVLIIRDLGKLTPDPANARSAQLVDMWQKNWSGLGTSDASAKAISDAIDTCREDVLEVLAALD